MAEADGIRIRWWEAINPLSNRRHLVQIETEVSKIKQKVQELEREIATSKEGLHSVG